MNNTMQTMSATFWASQRPIVAVLRARHEGPIIRVCKMAVLRGFKLEPRSTYTRRHLIGSRPVCGLQRPISKTWRHVDRQHGRNMAATFNKIKQNNRGSKEKKALLMTFCISQKTRFLEPFQYRLELFHYCIYPALYEKPVQNDKNGYFLACIEIDPPPGRFF